MKDNNVKILNGILFRNGLCQKDLETIHKLINEKMTRKTFINKVNKIDFSNEDEYYEDVCKLINSMPNCYAKGYIDNFWSEIDTSSDWNGTPKEQLLKVCQYDIW